jgi:hypothetical protein
VVEAVNKVCAALRGDRVAGATGTGQPATADEPAGQLEPYVGVAIAFGFWLTLA